VVYECLFNSQLQTKNEINIIIINVYGFYSLMFLFNIFYSLIFNYEDLKLTTIK